MSPQTTQNWTNIDFQQPRPETHLTEQAVGCFQQFRGIIELPDFPAIQNQHPIIKKKQMIIP